MGGNAIKSVPTRRYTTPELESVIQELIPALRERLETDVLPTVYYRLKETHGDLDVLVRTPCNDRGLDKFIKETLGSKELVRNGNVISFEYKELQVDLIQVAEGNFETSIMFYSYGELGNLMGKLARTIGLSYGYKGLVYKCYTEDKTVKLADITLSKDPERIFTALGLDYDTFLEGFDTEEDVFAFLSTSPFFTKSIGMPELQNHARAHRDKRRPGVERYRKYVDTYHPNDFIRPNWGRMDTINYISWNFPEIEIFDTVAKLEERLRVSKEIAKKFSGHIIMEAFPDITGVKLGHCIGHFRAELGDSYADFVLQSSQEEILRKFSEVNKIQP